ncbi:MAG: DUF502 domain-containing protein [Gammaproteobacteria bacterium]
MTPPPKRNWSLRRYLVAGLLVWLPILASLWVITFIVNLMDRTLLLLPVAYRPEALFGFPLPGLGIVFALVIVLITGLMVTNLIGRRIVRYWDGIIRRIPLVRSIHGGVKSFAESMFSTSSSFRTVVMIEYPRVGMWSIGFITADDVGEISQKTGVPHACVYVPTTPNPTAGFIMMVPKSDVVELEMSVDAAMKMIITCGVVMPPAPAARSTPRIASPAA